MNAQRFFVGILFVSLLSVVHMPLQGMNNNNNNNNNSALPDVNNSYDPDEVVLPYNSHFDPEPRTFINLTPIRQNSGGSNSPSLSQTGQQPGVTQNNSQPPTQSTPWEEVPGKERSPRGLSGAERVRELQRSNSSNQRTTFDSNRNILGAQAHARVMQRLAENQALPKKDSNPFFPEAEKDKVLKEWREKGSATVSIGGSSYKLTTQFPPVLPVPVPPTPEPGPVPPTPDPMLAFYSSPQYHDAQIRDLMNDGPNPVMAMAFDITIDAVKASCKGVKAAWNFGASFFNSAPTTPVQQQQQQDRSGEIPVQFPPIPQPRANQPYVHPNPRVRAYDFEQPNFQRAPTVDPQPVQQPQSQPEPIPQPTTEQMEFVTPQENQNQPEAQSTSKKTTKKRKATDEPLNQAPNKQRRLSKERGSQSSSSSSRMDIEISDFDRNNENLNFDTQIEQAREKNFNDLYHDFNHQGQAAQEDQNQKLVERNIQRLHALRETIENPELTVEFSTNFDQIVLGNCDYVEFFEQSHGTPLEQQLHMELCATVRDSAYQLSENRNNPQVAALAPVVQQYAAIAASTENKQAAFGLSDLSQSLNQLSQEFIDMCDANPVARAGRAAATGAINSVANNLTYALDHPVDAAVTAAIAAACGAPGVVAWQAYKIYENWDHISAASQQFVADIQNDKHHDSGWLDKNIQGFTQLACDIFLAPRVGAKIMNSSRISPLTSGFRQQAAMAQNCVNATAKKACENLKTIFKQAGDAIKAGNPQPAFAGINNNNNNGINNNNLNNNNNTSFKTAPTQPRRSERLAKKAEEASKNSKAIPKATTWSKIPNEELKKVGEKSLQSDIRQIKGSVTDAFNFFKAQVETFTERDPGTFLGKDKNGVTFFFRETSKFGPPTIDVNGIKGIRKIKFID